MHDGALVQLTVRNIKILIKNISFLFKLCNINLFHEKSVMLQIFFLFTNFFNIDQYFSRLQRGLANLYDYLSSMGKWGF